MSHPTRLLRRAQLSLPKAVASWHYSSAYPGVSEGLVRGDVERFNLQSRPHSYTLLPDRQEMMQLPQRDRFLMGVSVNSKSHGYSSLLFAEQETLCENW